VIDKRTLFGGVAFIAVAVVAVMMLMHLAMPKPLDNARRDTSVADARPDAAVTYAANRASAELVQHGLSPSPASEHETWSGSYAGPLTIAGSMTGTLGFHFDVTERSPRVVVVNQPGMFEVELARAPDHPNVAAGTGSYPIPIAPYRVDFEIAAAMRAGHLQIAIVTPDSQMPGHPEIILPGSRSVGEVPRMP
jgi:hypothetical protein